MRLFIKFFFLLTPFFVTSMMLTATSDWPAVSRRKLAWRIGLSGLVICYTLLFFGHFIFDAFGITVDAFRIGGGLLLLSGITLVNGKVTAPPSKLSENVTEFSDDRISNIAVVPLAMPVMIGHGSSRTIASMGCGASPGALAPSASAPRMRSLQISQSWRIFSKVETNSSGSGATFSRSKK